ncbi:MAG TPA: carbohydrate-binding domain-containing protein [Candidatus Thermoplasmatota archaeon]|nr:carbohydrate-binding domain-containing protein [Candidatus Thermoplasmatota archaeon]
MAARRLVPAFGLLAALVLVAPTVAQTPATVPLGLDYSNMQRSIDLGVKPAFASFWVGPWTKSDWSNFDRYLQNTGAAGVTPLIMWYYWGDDIRPNCVETGCFSSLHNTQKTRPDWNAMAQTLASHIRAQAAGKRVLVVVESEFNKNGIDSLEYAPKFDKYVKGQIDLFKGVPGVQVVIGFGNWGRDKWSRFPLAIQGADYIGYQAMSGMTRDSLPQYMANIRVALDTARYIQTNFRKPSILTDLAVSSYTEPLWMTLQDVALRQLLGQLGEMRTAGVQGIVYRSLRDVRMDPANYYGYAEQHWGLRWTANNTAKPAYVAWAAATKGEAIPLRVFRTPVTMEAEAAYAKSGGAFVTDPAASNLFVWRLPPGQTVGIQVSFAQAGTTALEGRARAASGTGSAAVLLGGSEVGRWSFGTTFQRQTIQATNAQGTYAYTVQNTGTTDLFLDWMAVHATTAPAPAPVQSNVTIFLSSMQNLQPVASHYREAEAMATKTAGGRQALAGASGGAVWNLWSNGHVEDRFSAYRNGTFQVEVRGTGALAGGVPPRLAVTVDGRAVGTLELRATGAYRTGNFQLNLGAHTVRVAFTNDAKVGTEDRNAILDRIGLVHMA